MGKFYPRHKNSSAGHIGAELLKIIITSKLTLFIYDNIMIRSINFHYLWAGCYIWINLSLGVSAQLLPFFIIDQFNTAVRNQQAQRGNLAESEVILRTEKINKGTRLTFI